MVKMAGPASFSIIVVDLHNSCCCLALHAWPPTLSCSRHGQQVATADSVNEARASLHYPTEGQVE